MRPLRGAVVGAGYFGRFHLEAWGRIHDATIVAVCDREPSRAASAAVLAGSPACYADPVAMLDEVRPDFLDIVTPPDAHLELCRAAAARGVHVICQKPFAPTLAEAVEIVRAFRGRHCRLMVHENFRFQPWYREARRLLDAGAIGGRLQTLSFRCRPGDGWQPDAYLARQPYFREMPRLLVHETGIHFIDTFRYLAGEVRRVHAILRRLNPEIRGEDCGLLIFEFERDCVGVWDADRYHESDAQDPRYTFGELTLEGEGGRIRLDHDGNLHVKALGEPERRHPYHHDRTRFGGDCVHATQRHFIDRLRDDGPFETDAGLYLRNLVIEEAVYESSARGKPVDVPAPPPPAAG